MSFRKELEAISRVILLWLNYCNIQIAKKTWMLQEGFAARFEKEDDCVRMDMMCYN